MSARNPTHHYNSQVPKCPSCHGRHVMAGDGPVEIVKGIEKAPAICGDCGREWKSENAQFVRLSKDLMKAGR